MGKLVCGIDKVFSYRNKFHTSPVQLLAIVTHSSIAQEVKKAIIGHFREADSGAMVLFRKVAISLRDDCPFYSVVEYVK